MRLALISAPLLALAAVVVASAAPAFAQEPTITITIKDHQFVPSEVPIPAGVRVELSIRNEQATPAEFESTSLHREKVVPPGGSASVFVGPLQPGRYEFFDDFHPASRGVLVVR
jgi:plastocyanin